MMAQSAAAEASQTVTDMGPPEVPPSSPSCVPGSMANVPSSTGMSSSVSLTAEQRDDTVTSNSERGHMDGSADRTNDNVSGSDRNSGNLPPGQSNSSLS